ncbi:putative MccF-like protein (microcin C7 resistance) [Xenococcus sp. PCC 7305]|uniref:S66 peptidase family protein n=1 Tax=Xenococcus sp. PCC 7305 TaxID=102125 RepID=UPI0002AC3376|nr:putative MccF-like protein (microcin C7 resistance) [Xenococcus sp. PCC 7305]
MPLKFPTSLKPGDSVIAIATSGAVKDVKALEAGLAVWRSRGYQVTLDDNWDARQGYLAGDDTTRRNALTQAWNDPQCKAILCIRGGYGSARLLENWNQTVPGNPSPMPSKWIIGFSDVTALLWSLATEGIASLHGPILTTLDQEPIWSQQRMFDYLEGGNLESLQGKGWGRGIAEGILLPANLSVATHILGTPLQPSLKGTILALEDINEYPYRIDRMLTQWRLMGVLSGVKGIALGRFSRCEADPGSISTNAGEVLRDRLSDLEIPIVSDLPFGHDGCNAVLPVGHHVRLDGDRGELSFLRDEGLLRDKE